MDLDPVDISSCADGSDDNLHKLSDHHTEDEEDQSRATADKPDPLHDDSHVYANISEITNREQIEHIDRRPVPPMPDVSDKPLRVIANGWREYKTLGGRFPSFIEFKDKFYI